MLVIKIIHPSFLKESHSTVRFTKITGWTFIVLGSIKVINFHFGNFLVLVLGNSVRSADW